MAKADFERVADHIRAQVDAGILKPGDQLPAYRELAEQYEVGITTIRSALLVLKLQGIIVGRPGKGTFVAQPDKK